jgi:hypothetical protein
MFDNSKKSSGCKPLSPGAALCWAMAKNGASDQIFSLMIYDQQIKA